MKLTRTVPGLRAGSVPGRGASDNNLRHCGCTQTTVRGARGESCRLIPCVFCVPAVPHQTAASFWLRFVWHIHREVRANASARNRSRVFSLIDARRWKYESLGIGLIVQGLLLMGHHLTDRCGCYPGSTV